MKQVGSSEIADRVWPPPQINLVSIPVNGRHQIPDSKPLQVTEDFASIVLQAWIVFEQVHRMTQSKDRGRRCPQAAAQLEPETTAPERVLLRRLFGLHQQSSPCEHAVLKYFLPVV